MGEEPTAMRPLDQPATDTAPVDDDPAKIRAEIVETRAEMSETIDAIQEKLSPQRLMDEAKQNVRDATVGKVTTMVNTVTDTAADVGEQVQDQARQAVTYVRDNPMPALLIGAGVAWLLMRSRGERPSYGGYRRSRGYRSYRDDDYGQYAGRSAYGGYPAGSRYRTGEGTSSSAESGESWTEAASDTAERMQRRVAEYGRSAETTLERWLRENPLTVGTVAIAAGAVVGLGLPRTRTEDAWMGEARDTLVERVQETAQQAVEKVGEVAEQVQQSAGGVSEAAGDVSQQLGRKTSTGTSGSSTSASPSTSTSPSTPTSPSTSGTTSPSTSRPTTTSTSESPSRTRTSGTGGTGTGGGSSQR